jgi:hypothetical protein
MRSQSLKIPSRFSKLGNQSGDLVGIKLKHRQFPAGIRPECA